jgi:hypothetical protein
MSWLDRILTEDPKKICPLCPPVNISNPHKGLIGDKSLGIHLSPTCPPMLALAGWDSELEALCARADPLEAQYLRHERSGILEFQGGLTREEAERRALARQ